MSVPTIFDCHFADDVSRVNLISAYSDKLRREGVVGCSPSIAAKWVTHDVTRRRGGELEIKTEFEMSQAGWYVIDAWLEGYAGIARPMIMHRSRIDTIASKHTQLHELLEVMPERLSIDNEIKKWISREKEHLIQEGMANFLQKKLDNLRPHINILYDHRPSSALAGIKWPEIAESTYLTDRLFKLTEDYLEKAIYAIEKGTYMVINRPTNLAIRARGAHKLDPANIVYGPAVNYSATYSKDRSRLAFFLAGPSSVNALQKGEKIDELKRGSQHSFIHLQNDLNIPRDFVTLYSRRGWIYQDIWNDIKKGYVICAFDGKAWEASSALMMGTFGSPFATIIQGYLLLTSGNFATSAINTACVGMTNEFFGIFDSGFKCYGAGDDDNILVKPEEFQDLLDLFWNVEFMEFQPMDTLMQYFLGFSFLDVEHPHSMGFKATRDSAGSYGKLTFNEQGMVPKEPNFLWKTFGADEVNAWKQVFTNIAPFLPKLDKLIEGLEYFSPHWLIENMPKHKVDNLVTLTDDPKPTRDISEIFDHYLTIKGCIPTEHYENMLTQGMV